MKFTSSRTAQFGDAQLRRFNLVAIDSRAHGETTGKVGKTYSQVTAAEDVAKIMVCPSYSSKVVQLLTCLTNQGRVAPSSLPFRWRVYGCLHRTPTRYFFP
jgi:hypothetical protein